LTGRRLALTVCPVLALLLYLPTLGCDFVFDDRGVIGANPLMQDIRDLPRVLVTPYWNAPRHERTLYRPVTSLSFALDRAVSGMKPSWFHGVNLLLHVLATLLVTRLAIQVLPGNETGAAIAGALFAAHPVHVEAVAGIVGRSEVLAAIGVLGAILGHRRALGAPAGRSGGWILGAWIACLLGMLAKESALTGPALCLLSETAAPLSGATRSRRTALYAGYVAAAVLYLTARSAVLGTLGIGRPIPFVDNPAASAGPFDGRLTGVGTLARYAGLLLWPARLSADYSYNQIPVIHSPLEPLAIGGLLLLAGIVTGGVWLRRRAPACGFALLFMAASAGLTTNIVLFIGTLMAERLMYLPSAGLCLIAGWAAARPARPAGRKVSLAIASLAVLLLCGRTWARLPDWKDDFSLYSSAARVSPRSARIRYNLGNAYLKNGSYGDAEEQYRAALSIYPEFRDARVNLAMALIQERRPQEGLDLLLIAARESPSDADIAVNLGTAHKALGDFALAEAEFRRALQLDPRSARAWNNLGSIELPRGHLEAAIEDLTQAVSLDPGLAIYRVNLADALNAASRRREAAGQFEAAYRLESDLPETHRGLGEVALERGDRAAAEREFRIAATAREPSARAANFLGYVLSLKGQFAEAAEQYERAIAIDPGLADAHRSAGLLYAQKLGDRSRALDHFKASLRLDPGQTEASELRRLIAVLETKAGS